MNRLKDGEKRIIRTPDLTRITGIKIVAYRMDSETPFIILKRDDNEDNDIWLDDVSAEELSKAITLALRYLPSSK